MFESLHSLSPAALRSLAASLRQGSLSLGLTKHGLSQIFGTQTAAVYGCLEELVKQGMMAKHLALFAEVLAESQERVATAQLLFELVLSGPDVPGVPTADTSATVQTLIGNAESEVVLVGYAVHNGKKLFKGLAERMERCPALRVVFCLDIARKLTDTSLASEIVRRFALDFTKRHWPGSKLPELYYDPRALAGSNEGRASLHAKCVIVDRSIAVVTSANFTEAAHHRNIEVGLLVREERIVKRLSDYFEGLRQTGQLRECPLKIGE